MTRIDAPDGSKTVRETWVWSLDKERNQTKLNNLWQLPAYADDESGKLRLED